MVAPAIRSRNTTVMAAMTSSGLLHYRVLEGPGNIERFCRFIEDLAAKREAASILADSILIMDNVAFHRGGQAIEKIRTLGLNGKYCQKGSSEYRSTVARCNNGFDAIVTPDECFNYCQHATNNCVAFLKDEEILG